VFTRLQKLSIALCLVALFTIFSTAAMADDVASKSTTSLPRTDARLAEDVAHGIRMYSHYDIFDWVQGKVVNGVVTLEGSVREPFHKSDYGKIVARIDGVKNVDNQLRVLPLSNFDDQIRRAASRAIYGDPKFTGYALQANPPIHIIVDNGKVTLRGVVANSMDKQVAETRVRTNVMAFDVINDLQVEEAG